MCLLKVTSQVIYMCKSAAPGPVAIYNQLPAIEDKAKSSISESISTPSKSCLFWFQWLGRMVQCIHCYHINYINLHKPHSQYHFSYLVMLSTTNTTYCKQHTRHSNHLGKEQASITWRLPPLFSTRHTTFQHPASISRFVTSHQQHLTQ